MRNGGKTFGALGWFGWNPIFQDITQLALTYEVQIAIVRSKTSFVKISSSNVCIIDIFKYTQIHVFFPLHSNLFIFFHFVDDVVW